MIPVPNDFLAAIRGSHTAVFRVTAVTAGGSGGLNPVGTDVPIISGTVRLDSTADERSALDLVVDGDWPVNHQFNLLAPFGQELYVERGIEGASLGGVTEYVPLGYFRIETVEQDDAPNSPLRITGRDRMAAIIEARMLEPRTYPVGTTVLDIFIDLVFEVSPATTISFQQDSVASSELRDPATVERDRYEFLRDLVTSRGQIMYFDRFGQLQITPVPDPTIPVWAVDAGPTGVLVNARRQLSRSGVYNAVVAEGTELEQGTTTAPPRAFVVDNDPDSATYFYGPYGQVPRFYASPFLFTTAQCTSAATSILAQVTGLPYSIDLTAVPNPALDPLDPISVRMGEYGVLDDAIVAITASADNPPGETKAKAFDQSVDTKWLTFATTGWLAVQLDGEFVVTRYALTSGDDEPTRDPKNWQLQGSYDGVTWTTIDTRTGETFASRKQTKEYAVTTPGAWSYYRLNITLNNGAPFTQLAEVWLYSPTGGDEVHVIDTITIPLSSDQPMTANTRATVRFSIT